MAHAHDLVGAGASLMSSKPGGSNRRDNAWHDVLEICKKGFANKMSSMSQEILTEVRSEVEQTSDSLRKDVADMLERREKDSNEKLADLNDKMNRVLNVAQTGYVDFSRFDLSPVIEEIRTTEAMAGEASNKVAQRLEENMVLVSSALEKITSKTDAEDAKLQSLMDRVTASEEKFAKVAENLARSMTQLSTDFRSKPNEAHTDLHQLTSHLSEQLEKMVNKPLRVDDEELRNDVRDVRRVVHEDSNVVLSEISKIQQALHLDFVQIMKDAGAGLSEPPPQLETTKEDEAGKRRITKSGVNSEGKEPTGLPVTKRVRVREFFTQTDSAGEESKWTQTDPKMTERKEKKGPTGPKKKVEEPRKTRGFNDAEALKKKARQALMKPQYNVFDQYYETGIFQRIAKSSIFENLTLGIVCTNALWMAIDTDLNTAALITDALPIFIVVENMFCTYFFCEVMIRFGAFKRKLDAFRDSWFIFDSILVFLMVMDTWIVPVVVYGFGVDLTGLMDLSMLRVLRLMKILRLSRMMKLLRAVPELTIILKGVKFAARSVTVFSALWMMIIFVYAILMRQLTVSGMISETVGKAYFASVPESINNLLINGILPDHQEFIEQVGGSNPVMWPIVVFFFFLVSVTIMYMLVGVLVEVVGVIATSEKEGLTVSYLASEFRDKMEQLQYNPEAPLTQFELQKMLLEPEITIILAGVGVDVIALIDGLDMIYEDIAKIGMDTLDFEAILEIVLNMRGGNQASVKDVKEQIRITKSLVKGSQWAILEKLSTEFSTIHAELNALREEALARDEADHDDLYDDRQFSDVEEQEQALD
eukprot:TRINITY_DN24085_c0_g1_i2.p1 TRINITY_DN24085_c0_g1~~TRINITY_DN24085_c0_g1_i2.p1  ORF type:complete len:818 (-),score=215.85 TRINITY_DN24085_c0_g1_i2:100-2553(-)